MRRAAVLGAPIAHSISPALHRAAYEELGLDWTYHAMECGEEQLPVVLAGMDVSWVGLSLTMPLKRAVLPLLDDVSDLAIAVGSANTVVFDEGRRRGDNTDVAGMLDALYERGVQSARTAVVLGGGATASATLAGLRELGVGDVAVVVRDPARAAGLGEAAERLGVEARVRTFADLQELLPVDLLVSTLPSGAADQVADIIAAPRVPHRGVVSRAPAGAVLDVCYDPWPTVLADAAHAAGYTVAGGFDLLLHQAAHQVTLMTGVRDVPVEAMRTAGLRALDARTSGD